MSIEKEIQYGEAEFFLADLQKFHKELFKVLQDSSEFLTSERRVTGELIDAFRDWSRIVKPKLEQLYVKINAAFGYLEGHGISMYLSHDLHGEIGAVTGFLNEAIGALEKGDPEDFNSMLIVFLREWERNYVTISDILLRSIDTKKIPESLIGTFDIDLLSDVVGYFGSKEKKKLDRSSRIHGSHYVGVEKKKFIVEANLEKIKKQLEGKKINGNNAVLINLLLNIFRNGFKSRMEADNVIFDAMVEGDELVLRVLNDGKGIAPRHVDLSNEKNIFQPGISGDNSSGLGLANAHTRVPSAGGVLRLVSQRRSEEGVITEFSTSGELPENYLYNIREQRKTENKIDVHTIWELRLKIENK